MFEAFLFSLQMYLVTLVMTPFGLVSIPQAIDILHQQPAFAPMVYGYLLGSPLLFRFYLKRLKRNAGRQGPARSSARKQWGRAVLWTLCSHFLLHEIIFFGLQSVNHHRLHPSLEAVALSAIALVVIAGSTGFLAYKHSWQAMQSRHVSDSTVYRE
jgi:hypothetical protein